MYHDESQEAGYWHGILLVPQNTRQRFLDQLEQIRANTGYPDPVCLRGLDKTSGRRYRCIRAWMQLGVAALIQKLKGRRYPFSTGVDRPTPQFALLDQVIGAKFILFRKRDGHQDLERYPDYAAKIETTFRMGLKGGLHLFVDESRMLTVRSLHFDGHKHYGRRIDLKRIVGRLGQLRDQVCIAPDIQLFDASSDHRKPDSQSYDDCQFLQLADILVGGFRTVLGSQSNEAQRNVAYPLRKLVSDWHRGPARMEHSRWYKGFCISECYLEGDEWKFADLRPPVPKPNSLFQESRAY